MCAVFLPHTLIFYFSNEPASTFAATADTTEETTATITAKIITNNPPANNIKVPLIQIPTFPNKQNFYRK